MLASELYKQIAAVCPIESVSIGDRADKSTWRIDFAPEATAAQKKAAQNILNAFDWNAEEATLDRREKHKRLAQLKAELAEAQANNDTVVVDAIQEEIDGG